ncbi:MAG: sigma-70 family RNA polymerase sigma factor [Planctomycetales bacterium]|nr:sigma-70 family RNA polymerase sigma factor [Planctomycetales bacterium]
MTDTPDSIEQSVSSLTASWLERVKTGDARAWEKLSSAYRDLICWWCTKGRIPEQDIEDVVQDVLAALSVAMPNFRDESFRGFLWTLTYNKMQDYWRAHYRRPRTQADVDVGLVASESEQDSRDSEIGGIAQQTRIVFSAIVRLVKGEFSETDWRVFWEYAVEGKPVGVVAESYGVSHNKVYLAKSRILRRIRAEFEDTPPPAS